MHVSDMNGKKKYNKGSFSTVKLTMILWKEGKNTNKNIKFENEFEWQLIYKIYKLFKD